MLEPSDKIRQRWSGCSRGHSDKFDPLIFLLQEMARVHFAKMGPKMQSIESKPGESHEAQPRLLQVLHGLQETSTRPPGRRTQARIRDGALNMHPLEIGISEISVSVSVRPRFILGLNVRSRFRKKMILEESPAPNQSRSQLLVRLPPMTSWHSVHSISQGVTVFPATAPTVMVPTFLKNY